MLQEQTRFLQRLLFVTDVVVIVVGWIVAYYIRFELLTPPEWLPLDRYLSFLPWVLLLSTVVFWWSGLYAPDRALQLTKLIFSVAKAIVLELLVVAASLSFYRALYFSRLHMILFGIITPMLMVLVRIILYAAVRRTRISKNKRRVLIVGAGKIGRKLASAFEQYPWMGLDIVGFVDDRVPVEDGVLGNVEETTAIFDRFEAEGQPIDYLYVALPLSASKKIAWLIEEMATRLVHVCLVPDLIQFDIINSRVSHLDGLPVIHVIDEAPIQLSVVMKRVVDIVFSLLLLTLLAPLMLAIAAAVKVSSPGPVFYRQDRMGLNGMTFQMLKFRSMPVDAERNTGPVWATPGEQRATRVGAFLRRTSLDELPQFVNVLRGDMSVVGPRPERPIFIKQFKDQVPKYMLRHKTKAGITGWAQVNGWRGNTSIEKRIEYDIYYIQHWSLALDLRIMWMTLWKGFLSRNAY